MAYRKGEFKPSEAAMRELLDYLRAEARALTNAAEDLEAALARKEGKDE